MGGLIPSSPSSVISVEEPKEVSEVAKQEEAEVSKYIDERRGRVGTINTSWRGLLEGKTDLPKRKQLLGE